MAAVLHISATPGIYDVVVGGISLWTTASLIAIDAAPVVSLLDLGVHISSKLGGRCAYGAVRSRTTTMSCQEEE